MIKVLKRVDWNIEYAELILNSYTAINPLREEEYRTLFAFLLFPQRFWRLSNRYYYNEVTWPSNTFNKKMEELISEKDKYINFIEEFKKYIHKKNNEYIKAYEAYVVLYALNSFINKFIISIIVYRVIDLLRWS